MSAEQKPPTETREPTPSSPPSSWHPPLEALARTREPKQQEVGHVIHAFYVYLRDDRKLLPSFHHFTAIGYRSAITHLQANELSPETKLALDAFEAYCAEVQCLGEDGCVLDMKTTIGTLRVKLDQLEKADQDQAEAKAKMFQPRGTLPATQEQQDALNARLERLRRQVEEANKNTLRNAANKN